MDIYKVCLAGSSAVMALPSTTVRRLREEGCISPADILLEDQIPLAIGVVVRDMEGGYRFLLQSGREESVRREVMEAIGLCSAFITAALIYTQEQMETLSSEIKALDKEMEA